MKKIQLTTFLKISGIGSASGLVYTDNTLYLISDNSGYLYQYDLKTNKLIKHALIDNPSENIIKSQKPDFEAITLKGNELHIFGSGSTKNRNKNIVFDIKTQTITKKSLAKLYQEIKSIIPIANENLNIEGALFHEEKLFLFQRGNGAESKNGIIIININYNNQYYIKPTQIKFIPVTLPKIKYVETSFTDAIILNDTIYFLASAEDTVSTYDDGEVLGSIIGAINIKTMAINFTQKISDTHKFEGLTLLKETSTKIIFLLCEDNDTKILQSQIYNLYIRKD